MSKTSIVLSAILGVILVVAITIGGWQLGWWMKSYSTNRNAQILQTTYGRQVALVDAINTNIKEAETPGIPAGQRVAIVNIICDDAGLLTGSVQLSQHAQRFVALECPQ